RQTGRDADGEAILRAALGRSPRDGGLHHALGLALVRLKRPEAALAELRHASELEPDRPRYVYVYAVALNSAGRNGEAIGILKDASARFPEDRDILLSLVAFSRDAGEIATALDYAERLARLTPGDRTIENLITTLRRSADAKSRP